MFSWNEELKKQWLSLFFGLFIILFGLSLLGLSINYLAYFAIFIGLVIVANFLQKIIPDIFYRRTTEKMKIPLKVKTKMKKVKQDSDELQYRKLFLDFYSSQLNTHSRLIIGFSVMLLTLIEIIQQLNNTIFKVRCIAYSGVFFLSLAIWYLLLRDLMYGVCVQSAISADIGEEDGDPKEIGYLLVVSNAITRTAIQQRILGLFSVGWYLSHRDRQKYQIITGIGICIAFAIVTTFLLIWLVDSELIF